MSEDKSDIHNGIAWAIIFALGAIIMSIVAVAHKCPRFNLDFDYIGLMVGILSLLVTALLGWQVFNAIENVKTLKKMEALESDLVKAISNFEQQDARNLDLIRAVNEIRKAATFKYEFTKYKSAAKAIKLLLSAKVPIEDDLIDVQKELLITILDGIEKEDDSAKATFADACPAIDDLYHGIIEAINARTEDLNAFKREITSIRDRRVAFANKYKSN